MSPVGSGCLYREKNNNNIFSSNFSLWQKPRYLIFMMVMLYNITPPFLPSCSGWHTSFSVTSKFFLTNNSVREVELRELHDSLSSWTWFSCVLVWQADQFTTLTSFIIVHLRCSVQEHMPNPAKCHSFSDERHTMRGANKSWVLCSISDTILISLHCSSLRASETKELVLG